MSIIDIFSKTAQKRSNKHKNEHKHIIEKAFYFFNNTKLLLSYTEQCHRYNKVSIYITI